MVQSVIRNKDKLPFDGEKCREYITRTRKFKKDKAVRICKKNVFRKTSLFSGVFLNLPKNGPFPCPVRVTYHLARSIIETKILSIISRVYSNVKLNPNPFFIIFSGENRPLILFTCCTIWCHIPIKLEPGAHLILTLANYFDLLCLTRRYCDLIYRLTTFPFLTNSLLPPLLSTS